MVKRLRRRPLTAKTAVRFRLGLPNKNCVFFMNAQFLFFININIIGYNMNIFCTDINAGDDITNYRRNEKHNFRNSDYSKSENSHLIYPD